jgi:hypothetical protein
MGKKQEHIGERYSLLVLVGNDRFVVQAAEESASSADILIVNPRYCNAQQPEVKTVGRSCARPPLQVGIGRIPTRSQYVPDTEICRVDANFENATQFLINIRRRTKTKKIKTKTHPEKGDQLCTFQEFCLWVCKFCPDLLESPHLLSRDRLCATRGLIHVRKVFNDKTCMA